jgi:secondary thiamine-phosphate synthase enzyme
MSLPAYTNLTEPAEVCAVHLTLRVKTVRPVQFIDLTDDLRAAVRRARIVSGLVNVQTRHTTTGILVNEHEPLLLTDLERALDRHAPAAADYRHDDMAVRTVNVDPGGVERRNGHAHCQAALLRTSECLNVADGQLVLGRWQRVLFVELDGGQPREISVMMLGTG